VLCRVDAAPASANNAHVNARVLHNSPFECQNEWPANLSLRGGRIGIPKPPFLPPRRHRVACRVSEAARPRAMTPGWRQGAGVAPNQLVAGEAARSQIVGLWR
jgi:hypothetical protein